MRYQTGDNHRKEHDEKQGFHPTVYTGGKVARSFDALWAGKVDRSGNALTGPVHIRVEAYSRWREAANVG